MQPNRTVRIKEERSGQKEKCKEYINNIKIKIKIFFFEVYRNGVSFQPGGDGLITTLREVL